MGLNWWSSEHRMVPAGGLKYHCVFNGAGPTIVLTAGFPQSCYAWRKVIPLLADRCRVITVDLPGQGDSDKPQSGYDTRTSAERMHTLLQALDVGKHIFVGHDIGSWVAYSYAHHHPQGLAGVALIDGNIPAITLKDQIAIADPDFWRGWHFLFNMVQDLPEALLAGKERVLIEWFFQHKTAIPMATFSKEDIDEYVRCYTMPGGLRGMLGYYRAALEDREQNAELKKRRLSVPVLALGGDSGSAPDLYDKMCAIAEDVSGGIIENSGHYIPEEQPVALAEYLNAFVDRLLS